MLFFEGVHGELHFFFCFFFCLFLLCRLHNRIIVFDSLDGMLCCHQTQSITQPFLRYGNGCLWREQAKQLLDLNVLETVATMWATPPTLARGSFRGFVEGGLQ